MTDFADKLFNLNTKFLQKPTMRFMPSQKMLRHAFQMTAKLNYRKLKGCKSDWMDLNGVKTLRIVPPGVTRRDANLLYVHGGGFTIGSPTTHRWMAARLAQIAGVPVFLPKYRLAPEHPFPAAHEDIETAFDALAEVGPVAIGGDSAGGQLRLSLMATGRMPTCAVLLSPLARLRALGSDPDLDFSRERLLPRTWAQRASDALHMEFDNTDPRQNPLIANPATLPPILIHAVKEEVLAKDAKDILAALPHADIEWFTGVPHVWQLHAGWSGTAD